MPSSPCSNRNDLLDGANAAGVRSRIVLEPELRRALHGTVHIQENAPETLETKRRVFAQLDAAAPPDAIIASSSSALLPSAFVAELPGRRRCLVAHPLNPPHLVPAVEIVPAPDTDPEVVARCAALMRRIGQSPIVLTREIEGFVMNRLQGALLEEAFRLIDAGIVSASDLDVALKDGLGLRWSFMGPVETIDLNAPGGVSDFVGRYGECVPFHRRHGRSAGGLGRRAGRAAAARATGGATGTGSARTSGLARPAVDGARRAPARRGRRRSRDRPSVDDGRALDTDEYRIYAWPANARSSSPPR